jgi:hypothetical protein
MSDDMCVDFDELYRVHLDKCDKNVSEENLH